MQVTTRAGVCSTCRGCGHPASLPDRRPREPPAGLRSFSEKMSAVPAPSEIRIETANGAFHATERRIIAPARGISVSRNASEAGTLPAGLLMTDSFHSAVGVDTGGALSRQGREASDLASDPSPPESYTCRNSRDPRGVASAPTPHGQEPSCAARYNLRSALAKVAELVDALDLGSSGVTRGGSSPPFRTSARPPGDSRRRGGAGRGSTPRSRR